jgi:ElaB/YqjD/DUF883 family membrane-anchored ribosome-binding protein
VAVTGESLGRLFVELGLADEAFMSGVKGALVEVGRLKDGVVKAGKTAAAGIKPLAEVMVQVTDREKKAAEATRQHTATEQKRAAALGLTVAQLREMDRALKSITEAETKARLATEASTAATKEAMDAEKARAAALNAADAFAANRAARGLGDDGSDGGGAAEEVADAAGGGAMEDIATLAALAVTMSVVTDGMEAAVLAASAYNNAFEGLRSVARAFGHDQDAVQEAAENLAADGLMSAADAAQAFKNALATGYSLEQATELLSGLKEQAVFNRQAHYSLGEAVIAVTDGIKNENSTLADATGTTQNLSKMWEAYAEQLGKAPGQLTAAEKRQASYNGFLNETKRSAGDLAKAQTTLAGTIAMTDTATKKAQVSVGEALTPAYRLFLEVVGKVASAVGYLAETYPEMTAGVLSAVVALGALTTAMAAASAAAVYLQASLGPVGWASLAVSALIAGAIAAYTAFTNSTEEAAKSQEELAAAMGDVTLAGALKRQRLSFDALREAEVELQEARESFFPTDERHLRMLELKVEALRETAIAAEDAIEGERELQAERDRAAAGVAATTEAEKKLAELRKDNLSEVDALEAEMNEVLNSLANATPDVLENIRAEYMKKISEAQQKAAAGGEAAAAKLQAQIDKAKSSIEGLQAMVDDADARASTARAEVSGQDPAIADLEAKLRAVALATDKAIEDAREITDAKAREAATDAVIFAGQAAKDAAVREWAALGEVEAQAEADAYEKKQADRRKRTADLVNKIERAAMTESQRLASERDAALLAAYDATEAQKVAITESYNKQIADADAELAKKRVKEANKVRDAYVSTFSQIVGKIESVASTIAGRHVEQMELVQAQLDAAEEGEISLTETQKAQLEARLKAQKSAAMAAFAVQKAMAIVSIAINTATAIMSLYAQLPLPAAIAASIVVGALGAVQIGLVASEQPEFEKGGMITEAHRRQSPGTARGASVNADLHVGEGVLTAGRGMSAVGGAAGLAMLNAGIPLGALAGVTGGRVAAGASSAPPMAGGRQGAGNGGAPIRLQTMLDGSVVDDVMVTRWENGQSQIQRRVYKAAGVRVGLAR